MRDAISWHSKLRPMFARFAVAAFAFSARLHICGGYDVYAFAVSLIGGFAALRLFGSKQHQFSRIQAPASQVTP